MSDGTLQANLANSSSGGLEACGITKYSASHSFNPLLLSKSTQNLSVKKVERDFFPPIEIPFCFCLVPLHTEVLKHCSSPQKSSHDEDVAKMISHVCLRNLIKTASFYLVLLTLKMMFLFLGNSKRGEEPAEVINNKIIERLHTNLVTAEPSRTGTRATPPCPTGDITTSHSRTRPQRARTSTPRSRGAGRCPCRASG